ncbi:MAG TPA: DNA polymerase Y family protein [Ohtaekwangia sp.]|uniref:Y-family DNA polymerase n=1 Tax=Ohtaekwangia sp. TaxID=2066019 RepID=UPI002F9540F5
MDKRYVSIWFRHLSTDWFALRQVQLNYVPFALRAPLHGRMIITATNAVAEKQGIYRGMSLADARAFTPDLEVLDDKPDLINKLLTRLAEWCIRFTPVVAIDPPDGLILDATGCTHLWKGDIPYLNEIIKRLNDRGYDVQAAIADTIGVAWGVARFGGEPFVIPRGMHIEALMNLPPEALRLEAEVIGRLHKLGLHQIRQFIHMPRPSLRRRFGQHFMMRLDMALGQEIESIPSVQPIEPYSERLPCLEPIVTATGIEIALKQLLETLCFRLQQDQKGLRTAIFKGYRIDGKVERIEIGTNRPSHHVNHLFKLFEVKLQSIEPALGIELFVLGAPKVEDYLSEQQKMWEESGGLNDPRLSELIDRLASKTSLKCIHRYIPDEHYWPERSFKPAASLNEKPTTYWCNDKLRPLQVLPQPEPIEVTAPIPDYPPMLFRYKGIVHQIVKADGPERIEQEWWLQQGQHRDYYRVEDEHGHRYWLFRLGHYHDKTYKWFIHGFFA